MRHKNFQENLFFRKVLVHNSKLLHLIESFRGSFQSFRNWTNIQMLNIYNFSLVSGGREDGGEVIKYLS